MLYLGFKNTKIETVQTNKAIVNEKLKFWYVTEETFHKNMLHLNNSVKYNNDNL